MRNPYIKTDPKKWTKEEEKQLVELKKTKTFEEIAKILDRSIVSVNVKYQKIKKKQRTYNQTHLEEKKELNRLFLEIIQPTTVFDVFAGEKSYYVKNPESYKHMIVTSNDQNPQYETDYHMDYLELLGLMYSMKNRYDLIDLDPFGSAFDGFDLAIKMAKKGLIVTLGELGHKRFKRLDFVKYRYDIKNIEEFTAEKMIEKIKQIGLANKKELNVVYHGKWTNISRVYFAVREIKITEQWESKKNDKTTIFNSL